MVVEVAFLNIILFCGKFVTGVILTKFVMSYTTGIKPGSGLEMRLVPCHSVSLQTHV